jgi:protein-tyrosine phosphatase
MKSVHNFRDFGGYRARNGSMVKRGMLFRSASLAGASDEELEKIFSLGIKTICDLRTDRERAGKPYKIPANSEARLVHIPIKVKHHHESWIPLRLFSVAFGKGRRMDFSEVAKDIYQELVSDFRFELAEVLKLVSDKSNLPILIHCTGGKDRTGIACALIQSALGIPAGLVEYDYLLSNDRLHTFKTDMLRKMRLFLLLGVNGKRFLPLLEARREYLEAAYGRIKNDYGTLEEYFRHGLGLTDLCRSRLNALLLESAEAA